MWGRRTHRVSSGVPKVAAGSMTYVSESEPQPLGELEEALLIAATGCTGLTMPDRPFADDEGNPVMAKPNLTMDGRTAGSPDNAQGTHFFLINDSGTYFLRKLPSLESGDPFDPGLLLSRAAEAKVKILDHRLDVAEGADMACAASDGRDHPVFGLWPLRLRHELRHAMVAEGIRKVDLWTARYRMTRVDFPLVETPAGPLDPFFNTNRPEDLAEAKRFAAM
ncbi:MAG: hypothetical protein IH993_07120 [Proteobacteria bacterium]|nr:hypothetical protein [Pseudomonadota bacterium]